MPLFIVNEQMTSVFTIKNGGQSPVKVSVEFNSLEGEGVARKDFFVGIGSERRIDLDGVKMQNHRFEGLGSIEVHANGDGLSGWVTMARRSGALPVVTERLQLATKQQALAAVAIPPEPLSVPVLAIHSWSASPQTLLIDCSDAEDRAYESQVTLPPRMTFLVNACITGQADGRTYSQLLNGDLGKPIHATKIEVRTNAGEQAIAVWGLTTATNEESSSPTLVGIEFAQGRVARPSQSSRGQYSSIILLAGLPSTKAAQSEFKAPSEWTNTALQSVRDSKLDSPIAARTLAIVHTCMYDAWAAYDDRAVGTQLAGALRRPATERTLANKEEAISYAAYRALTDLLPGGSESIYRPFMMQLGYDPNDNSTDIETPAGIGNVACAAVLEFRHHDKSNQLGDLAQGAYSDWTHFRPVNMPAPFPIRLPTIHPIDMNHWQPLIYVNYAGDFVTQMFAAAQWCYVIPFALSKADEFRLIAGTLGPAKYGSEEYRAQAEELIQISAHLNDREKLIAEYWSDGPDTEQPPGHWLRIAQWVSIRDHHTLDEDVKMFFVLSNALLDSGIAAWDMKRTFDSVRPVTAIPFLFAGKKIRAWGGPSKGTVAMDGSQWIPYQAAAFPTPPFPDYVSEHSTYSAAAAAILSDWTSGDHFGYSVTLPAGSSKIEPGITPSHPVVLKWDSFSDAANEAGMSRRYGGIHFRRADLAGRELGRLVAAKAWARAQSYFDGTAKPIIQQQTEMTEERPMPARH